MNTFKTVAILATVTAVLSGSVVTKSWAASDNKKQEQATSADSGTMDRADSDMRDVLTNLKGLNGKPLETLTAVEARKQPTFADAVAATLKKDGKDINEINAKLGVKTQDVKYKAAAGEQPARIYIPEVAAKAKEPLPVIVYYHGGGWVIADINVYDATPRALAKEAKAIVISAEYRHAPENKFPAAHDDAFAAYKWALENASKFGGDPSRIALVGESAGGNLAANVAIMARDAKMEMPKHMVLVYPVAGNDMNTESYVENQNAVPLNKAMMGWFVKNVIKTDADKNDPRINLLAADLKGLPSATVITAEIDPLRSEGEALAQKLKDAGVEVDAKNYEGVTHEFFGAAAVIKDAAAAQSFAAGNLRDALEKK